MHQQISSKNIFTFSMQSVVYMDLQYILPMISVQQQRLFRITTFTITITRPHTKQTSKVFLGGKGLHFNAKVAQGKKD